MNRFYLMFFCCFLSLKLAAHSIDNSVLAFSIDQKKVSCVLQIPLQDLQFVVGFDVSNNAKNLVVDHHIALEKYIKTHFRIVGNSGITWQMSIVEMNIVIDSSATNDFHKNLVLKLIFQPLPNETTRTFTVFYDAIMHQLITHKAIVLINQDWENGIVGHQNSEIGIITFDISKQMAKPFIVQLQNGNNWKGFKAMFWLGINHISEGVDHLMFLLLLLLPAPLLVVARKWNQSQNWKSSFVKILKIVTGFTVGHSITLFIGTMQWFQIPVLAVEVVVALSIFITAIHALKPIFYNREIIIAVVFGLIHGLAFSQTLIELNLSSTKMFISLLGFNIGVEAMQLCVIVVIMPLLVYLSRSEFYKSLRISLALFGATASIAWVCELLTDNTNKITNVLSEIPSNAKWLVFALVLLCILQFFATSKKKNTQF